MSRRARDLLLIFFSSLVVAFIVAVVVQGERNYLLKKPEWRSEKAELAMGVNGAQSFLVAPNALAGRRLNLGAWHGHQSLILDRVWPGLPKVTFLSRAASPGYVVLELRGSSRRLAFRLSNDPARLSAVLELDDEGNFLTRRTFDFTLPATQWGIFSVTEENGAVVLRESGRELVSHAFPVSSVQLVLRGSGSASSLVDDFTANLRGESYQQDFSGKVPWLEAGFVAALFIVFFGLLYLRIRRESVLITAWLLPLGAAAVLFFYEASLAIRYPAAVDLQGRPNRIESRSEVVRRLQELPAPSKKVVLWLGGSQTWGAGASSREKTVFSRVEKEFPNFTFVNGAFSDARIAELHDSLKIIAGKASIHTVVLVVGVNDTWNPNFEGHLRELIVAIKEKAQNLLLVVEPSELTSSQELNRALDLVRTAKIEDGMKRFDLYRAFQARGDRAFDWWDFVHFTDAGHSFSAKELQRELSTILGSPAAGAQL